MLIIPRSVVQDVLEMKKLIPLIENSLKEFSLGRCVQPETKGIDLGTETGLMEVFIGYLKDERLMAVKTLNFRKKNPRMGKPLIYAHITLIDPDTGETLALIEGGSVTASRTAAASAVAAKYLSRTDSCRMALIGTGRQGRTHLEALLQVRPLRRVTIFDKYRESAEKFRSESLRKYDIEIEIAESAESAVGEADIIQLCTTTIEPVVFGAWVRPGTHINSIASYAPSVREVDTELVRKARVVADTRQGALRGAGELVIPLKEGAITEDHLYGEIGEIAAGLKPGRMNDSEITLYKSMGIAAEDAAAADFIYRAAKDHGFGMEVSLEE